MKDFFYKGLQDGKVVRGNIRADTHGAAIEQLKVRGIKVIRLEAGAAESFVSEILNYDIDFSTVSDDELIAFARQMESMLHSGIALVSSLSIVRDTLSNTKLKKSIAGIIEGLENGFSLVDSMSKFNNIFPEIFLSIIQVGESTGNLDEAFHDALLFLEHDKEIRQKINSATRYPSFVIISLIAALIFINLFVVPPFKQFFEAYDTLPLATRIIVTTSDTLIHHWDTMLYVIGGFFLLVYLWFRQMRGVKGLDRIKLHLPIIGSILTKTYYARFAKTLALTLNAGIPLLRALNIVANSIGNKYFFERIILMNKSLETGISLYESARKAGIFSPLILQVIKIGEESGELTKMFREVSENYDREVDYEVRKLTETLEPILLISVAGMVLLLALGVFVPMWDISSNASF